MGEIRHLAMSVPDPWLTASFYQQIFGLECVGETDSSLAEGVYVSDGVVNLAVLNFKSDEMAQGTGRDFVGLHHFGLWIDDVAETQALIEKAGGEWVMGEPDVKHNGAYEVKFRDINGVILDITHTGWAGTQRRPGVANNIVAPPRSLVPRFDERRETAARKVADLLGPDHKPTPGQLRHFAMSVPDPWATAAFYTRVFGFEVVGETDSSLAEGTFLSDGLFNIALLHFKTDHGAQGKGRDFVGLHHFGMWVEAVEPTQRLIEAAGGQWLMGEPDYRHNAAYEVKFHDLNGIILDLVHNGWAGTQRRPGETDNQVTGARSMVARYEDRRGAAAEALAARMGGERVTA